MAWTEAQWLEARQRVAAIHLKSQKLHENHTHTPGIPDDKPKPHTRRALESKLSKQESRVPRITVRITGHRCHPLDPDNFAGSCKEVIDGLRRANLIPGDEFWRIRLETDQEKVRHYKDEKTVIIIDIP